MYTTPADFSDYQNQLDGPAHMILELTDGTSSWLLSDVDMRLTDGPVHGLLTAISGIDERLPIPFSWKWATGSVSVTLSNREYQRVDGAGTFDRLSDQLSDIQFYTATIYFMAGSRADSLAGCMTRFVGIVKEAPKFDEASVLIRLVDAGWLRDTQLPQRRVSDAFAGAPSPFDLLHIPLAYGKFTQAGNDSAGFDFTGDGLAVGAPVKTYENKGGDDPKYVFADHLVNAISEMWLRDNTFPHPHLYTGPTLDDNEGESFIEQITVAADRDFSSVSGNWTQETMNAFAIAGGDLNIAASASGQYCELTAFTALIADHTYRLTYDYTESGAGFEFVTNAGQVIGTCVAGTAQTLDFYCTAAATEVRIRATTAVADGEFDNISILDLADIALATGTDLECYFYVPVSNIDDTGYVTDVQPEPHDPAQAWDNDETTSSDVYNYNQDDGVGCYGMDHDSDMWSLIEQGRMTQNRNYSGQALLAEDFSDDTEVGFCKGVASDPSSFSSLTVTGSWQTFFLSFLPLTPPTTGLPLMMAFKGTDTGRVGPGPDTYRLLRVYEARFRFSINPALHENGFAALEGRKYGKWLSDRSSNYSYGDAIEDPVGIMESILRRELGFVNTEIDMPTFIAGENTSVKARLNLHTDNQMAAFEAIRSMAEQSTVVFFFSGSGQATIVDLDDKSPTTTRVIPWSHIVPGSVKVSKSTDVINHLTVNSRYQQEYGLYRDQTLTEDTTSQALFAVGSFDGKFKYEADWPNITGTSVAHVAAFLVNSTDGLWSTQHKELALTTKLFTNADLEVGDWIELQAASVDPHLKCFGASWASKQFIITRTTPTVSGTKIMGVELWP